MPCKILLPVDGSEGSLRAARHVADCMAHVSELEVHLVNVQPRADDWQVRRLLKPEELAAMEAEWAEDTLAPARTLLDQAGARSQTHIVQGEVAESIARLATELGCDQIVMGTHGRGALGDLLMGSVASQVLHHARVPVTFVK
jgi:nucleotide-binding universal stress UspA family protein